MNREPEVMTVLETPHCKSEQMPEKANQCAIAVLGLGNVLRTDDGFGIHVIRGTARTAVFRERFSSSRAVRWD
jgi:hypothetical protein